MSNDCPRAAFREFVTVVAILFHNSHKNDFPPNAAHGMIVDAHVPGYTILGNVGHLSAVGVLLFKERHQPTTLLIFELVCVHHWAVVVFHSRNLHQPVQWAAVWLILTGWRASTI